MDTSSRGPIVFSPSKDQDPVGDDVIIVSGDFEKVILPKDTLVLGIGSHDIQFGVSLINRGCKP